MAKRAKTRAGARISVAAFNRIARTGLPLVEPFGLSVDRIGAGRATGRMAGNMANLRPGGTISGPALMALADYTMYAVVLSVIGPVEMAVTSSLTCNFLRKPRAGDVIAEGRIIRCGKRLAYGEVTLYSEGDRDPVAHVTATYAIPSAPTLT
ncbi:MAG: PaaI family thioesterase [Alphaproteobacteria bacterium]|nr:PaaI family thioesterase [Alphaproteobacteria bacterium]